MSDQGTITEWISGLKSGSEESAEAIWREYFSRLTRLASQRLKNASRRVTDEEDVAASALFALCRGARENRFRRLENRDDLWQILVMITARKSAQIHRKQNQRAERGESALLSSTGDSSPRLEELLQANPTQGGLDSLDLVCGDLLACLEPKLQEVALLKLAGHTNEEVAEIRNRSVKTIERYLQLIRLKWTNRQDA